MLKYTYFIMHSFGDLSTPLKKLTDYIRSTWMGDGIWSPEAWSIYKCAIRTNNDTEGWHNRINSLACGHALPFYRLINLLHDEASLVDLQVRLLDERKLKRYQRKTYKNVQRKVFFIWEQYENGEMVTTELLRECAGLYTPCL